MVRFVLLLFLLSDWAYMAWSAPLREPAPGVPLCATQQVSPIAIRFREQVLQQIELIPVTTSDRETVPPPSERTFELVEPTAPWRPAPDDLLYTYMSLQR